MFTEFLTVEGERLLAKAIEGTATLTFTKMEIGDGDRGTTSRNIDSLQNKVMSLDIYAVSLTGDNIIQVTSILKSQEIEKGFYFREKGIYATDGTTEVLMIYGTSGSLAEWASNMENSVFERTIRTLIALSASDQINITLQDGVYATGTALETSTAQIIEQIKNIDFTGNWATQEQAVNILGVLDAITSAYTSARATLLDNLDAKMSSRAPASTALSNTIWTNVRASAIDTINTNASRMTSERAVIIDSIGSTSNTGGSTSGGTVMAKLNGIMSQTNKIKDSFIKSIQRGTFMVGQSAGTMNIGINYVDTNKAIILLNGTSGRTSNYSVNVYITNFWNTGFTVKHDNYFDTLWYTDYQVIEFY